MHRLPEYLVSMTQCSHDVDAILRLGAEATSDITCSAAVVLVRRGGALGIGALHDSREDRRGCGRALDSVALDGSDSPFATALDSGQKALLGIGALAVSAKRRRGPPSSTASVSQPWGSPR